MLEIGPRKAFVCAKQHKQRINADIFYAHVASDVRTRHSSIRGAENCTGLE